MVDGKELGDLIISPLRLRIATRESALALWQAHFVQSALQRRFPACDVQVIGMTTRGDQILDRSLAAVGGKGLFTKELETALIEDRADLAVHSLKDVPMELPGEFLLAAILKREDPRDAFVSASYTSVQALPPGARVGTSSLRRQAQLMSQFPHLNILPLRGNVITRLAKLDQGQYEAIVLAAAGLKRLNFVERIAQILPPSISLPAAGQGALAIETLATRADVIAAVSGLGDLPTSWSCQAERVVSRMLGGSCRAPLAAFGEPDIDGHLSLRALAASLDGKQVLRAQARAAVQSDAQAQALGAQVAQQLLDQGAQALVAQYG